MFLSLRSRPFGPEEHRLGSGLRHAPLASLRGKEATLRFASACLSSSGVRLRLTLVAHVPLRSALQKIRAKALIFCYATLRGTQGDKGALPPFPFNPLPPLGDYQPPRPPLPASPWRDKGTARPLFSRLPESKLAHSGLSTGECLAGRRSRIYEQKS